jgi:hypothetical protein
VLTDTRDESQVEPGIDHLVVCVAQRKPLKFEAEEKQSKRCQPEIGE